MDATRQLLFTDLAVAQDSQFPKASVAMDQAATLEVRAWRLWIEEAIATLGRDRLRQKLEAASEQLRKRFAPHAPSYIPPRGRRGVTETGREPAPPGAEQAPKRPAGPRSPA